MPSYISKSNIALSIMVLLGFLSCSTACKNQNKYQYSPKVDSILQTMTLNEKVGQMLNIGLPALLKGDFYSYRDTLVFDSAKVKKLLVDFGAGSVQNLGNYPLTPAQWQYIIDTLQIISKTQTRLGLPVLYGIDAVHGANYTAGSTMFPHQINIAATFSTANAQAVASITAKQLVACKIPWNYAPVLDVARHQIWGRMFESFGEDTYLTTQLGVAAIKGYQQNNNNNIIACAKHFIGYGASYNGKDRSPTLMPENYMRQVLLPPFEQAVKNGLMSVMVSSGTLNGTPCHSNYNLITNILKGELGFKGVVITDWGDIDNLVSVHRVAQNEREAVKMSVLAGVDICMEPYDESFAVHLIDLVKTGEVPMSRIDDAVRRIINLKIMAGLFNNVNKTPKNKYVDRLFADSVNLQVASQSLTLLKNNNVLPLKANQKILVTGVAANSINYLNGAWSRTWAGTDTAYNDHDKNTILTAIENIAGKNNVLYSAGTGYTNGNYIADAVKKAKYADVIVVCVGEKPATEKPSDIDELDLPVIQQQLVKQLAATGKPVVMVMVQGRPRIIRQIEPLTNAILMAYLPGNEGGTAIANVLFGKFNPCGKLPYTYPRYSGSLLTYDHQLSDERDTAFGLNGFNPQYQFGHGLSYTTFEYSNLNINSSKIDFNDTLKISVNIKNTGNMAGTETVLLFVSDQVSTISPAVKLLKRFDKVTLKPGQNQTIHFFLTAKHLCFVNNQNQLVTEPGYFTVTINGLTQQFLLNN